MITAPIILFTGVSVTFVILLVLGFVAARRHPERRFPYGLALIGLALYGIVLLAAASMAIPVTPGQKQDSIGWIVLGTQSFLYRYATELFVLGFMVAGIAVIALVALAILRRRSIV